MSRNFRLSGRLDGRFKWAIFLAVILSAALSYVFFFDNDYATKIELQKVAVPILRNDEEIVRAWKKMNPETPIDTSEFTARRQAVERIFKDSLRDIGEN